MIKPATVSLCFACLLAAAGIRAQNAPAPAATADAISEAVRRQAYTIELRQKLEAAQGAEQRKELTAASKLYEA